MQKHVQGQLQVQEGQLCSQQVAQKYQRRLMLLAPAVLLKSSHLTHSQHWPITWRRAHTFLAIACVVYLDQQLLILLLLLL